MWNLEGQNVSGKYLGTYPFTGVVLHSRVKYGGSIAHYVKLDEEINVCGTIRDEICVDGEELN